MEVERDRQENDQPVTILQYEHFDLSDPKFNFLKSEFPDYGGLCWFACLVMAAQALDSNRSQAEIITELHDALFSISKQEIAEILQAMRAQDLPTVNFFKAGQLGFINEDTGGLDRKFQFKHPRDYVNFVNFLFERKNLNLHLDIVPLVIRANTFRDFPFILKKFLSKNQVPLISTTIIEPNALSGHMIMVGGIEKNQIIISDPNTDEPVKGSYSQFTSFLQNGINYSPIPNSDMDFDANAGILLLSKRSK